MIILIEGITMSGSLKDQYVDGLMRKLSTLEGGSSVENDAQWQRFTNSVRMHMNEVQTTLTRQQFELLQQHDIIPNDAKIVHENSIGLAFDIPTLAMA